MLRKLAYIMIALALPSFAFGAPVKRVLDTTASKVEWRGSKALVNSVHSGTVNIAPASFLMVDGSRVTGGEIIIDMTTIVNTDLKDANMNGKLVGHLKSPDFFDVEKNKEAKFVIKKVVPQSEGVQAFEGDLTIRGVSQPAKILAGVTTDKNVLIATGKIDFDRTKFNVKYNSKSVFPDLVKSGKDKVINDQVDLNFEVRTAAK